MRRSKIEWGWPAALVVLVLVAASCGGDKAPETPAAQAKELHVLYTANVGGEVDPCG